MPIRDKTIYPPDWDERSLAVKQAAGWRCECTGYCNRGSDHLGTDGRCVNRHGEPAFRTGAVVVLTTAHLNHDPGNWDNPKLAGLCPGCHLSYDTDHHRETRAATKRALLEAAGQSTLPGVPDA